MLFRSYSIVLSNFRRERLKAAFNCTNYKYVNNKPKSNQDDDLKDTQVPLGLGKKYKIFQDEDARKILDVNEELFLKEKLLEQEEKIDEFEGLNLERGITGVFDIEDLVEVLRRDKGKDIFVAELPPEVQFGKYICIVSGNSRRHIFGLAEFVRKLFKRKMNETDHIPKIEGENSDDWMALDLGNIALHIFTPNVRLKYDLESLWTVGPKYDPESNKEDTIVDLLEKHSIILKNFKPAS